MQKKRRQQHGKSILHKHDGTCYLCMLDGDDRQKRNVQKHHIYGGPNRWKSEAEGSTRRRIRKGSGITDG